MSIPVLNQVYEEMRRLAIAGSMVAAGDFRLKKLLPPLEQAGAKAPVFAKVAQAVKAVVESPESASASALLELTTLVTAILYTQGEVGADGPLEPIETVDLGAPATQAGARVLKPLLEALSTTGSGRLELIRDAHERGAFRDLRLIKPALAALDDVYPEIADLIAEKVLPIYGKAILPELRAKFDVKGRGGHPRRLRLMHRLDPAAARDLVKQALDAGSKEVKIAALECLGDHPEDLSYLIEQAAAKAQDVRAAAYQALAKIDDPGAVAVLQKALAGKDLELAAPSLRNSRSAVLLAQIIAAVREELADLSKVKDKKEAGRRIGRAVVLLNCLSGRSEPAAGKFLLEVFERRGELAKIKGDGQSGPDLNSAVVRILAGGGAELQTALAEAHATLPDEDLGFAFHAARAALPADRVFAEFSPYLAEGDGKKKSKDPARARREAVREALGGGRYRYWWPDRESVGETDPRWLDVAVQLEDLELVHALIRPGHAGAEAFLQKTFEATVKKSKDLHDCLAVVAAMVRAAHPGAADAFVAVLEKFGKKNDYFVYWFGTLVSSLPKSALPRIEALIPELHERVADHLMGSLQQLRDRKD